MSNQPDSSHSKGTERDFSTMILEKKKVDDENSVVDATTEKLPNIQLDDAIFKANDTNKLYSESMKYVALFDVGTVVAIYCGKCCGRVGIIKDRASDNTIQVEDPTGSKFVTHTGCAVPVLKHGNPWVLDVPWATVMEEAKRRMPTEEEERQAKEERRQAKEERRQWRQKEEEKRQKKRQAKEERRQWRQKEEEKRQKKEQRK